MEYDRLLTAVEEAQQRAEAMGMAYEEHVDMHRQCGTNGEFGLRSLESEVANR
jgi:hypothetical protein